MMAVWEPYSMIPPLITEGELEPESTISVKYITIKKTADVFMRNVRSHFSLRFSRLHFTTRCETYTSSSLLLRTVSRQLVQRAVAASIATGTTSPSPVGGLA